MTRLPYRLTISFILFHSILAAQPGYKSFVLQEDNKPIQINTLFKRFNGYLLAGTNNGLYKFDGERFSRIHFENKDYNDTVTAIFEDVPKKLWIGFGSGRIAHVINNKLQYYNPEEGTPHKKITAFIYHRNIIWYASYGEGLYYINNGHHYLFNADDGMSDLNISAIAGAGNDVIAATDQGINICSFSGDKKNVRVIGPAQGLPDYIVTSIVPSGNNTFWIGLQDKGFCLYDHTTGKITVPKTSLSWNYGQVSSMMQDQNTLWIATASGLLHYSIPNEQLQPVPDASSFAGIQNLQGDNQGNIWFSSAAGLTRTPGNVFSILKLTGLPAFDDIHAILADRNNNVWMNDKQSVLRFDRSGTNKKIRLPGLDVRTEITSLYQDKNGFIWAGTMGSGIFIIDSTGTHFRPVTEYPGFTHASILSISGRDNAVFISSLQGTLIADILPVNKHLDQPYAFTFYDNIKTGTDYIYSIFRDSKGRTWFATDGKGLTMMENGLFTYFNDRSFIRDDHVYSITEDQMGNIWFSTGNAGVYKTDGLTFTNYSVAEGLSDLEISALRTDRSGNILVINKKGFDVINPATGTISYINNNMGIGAINATDLGAVTQDTSGNVWVSSATGILSYSSHSSTVQKPLPVIESVQLFLKELDDSASNHFSYDENNFTFNYTGLYYTSPDQVYYHYKLEGFDTTWVLTKDRTKTFPRLEPGSYTFRLRASLNRNFKNADEASYHFVIQKPFFKTAWFIIACILLLSSILYMYVKNRERNLKNIQRLNEEKIQFRFEVLRNQVNPHFLFNSFNTLISAIEDDPKMAVEYVEHLSNFFRNIVNYRDTEVISVGEEIKLLETYFFLQQKRYGSNLAMENRITEEEKNNTFIPPLTLQLLFENAIKHNVVSKEKPLVIVLETSGESLVVQNVKNERLSVQAGAGMGLQNIMNRYHLLTKKEVKVLNTEKQFRIELPLIKKL